MKNNTQTEFSDASCPVFTGIPVFQSAENRFQIFGFYPLRLDFNSGLRRPFYPAPDLGDFQVFQKIITCISASGIMTSGSYHVTSRNPLLDLLERLEVSY